MKKSELKTMIKEVLKEGKSSNVLIGNIAKILRKNGWSEQSTYTNKVYIKSPDGDLCTITVNTGKGY